MSIAKLSYIVINNIKRYLLRESTEDKGSFYLDIKETHFLA